MPRTRLYLKIINFDNLVSILSRVAEGLGPVKPQQPVFRKEDAGATSYPVWPGEIRSCAPHASCSCLRYRGEIPWTIHTSGLRTLLWHSGGNGPCHLRFVRGLKCRLCGKAYPISAINFCTEDFGPLEVDYDYEAIAEALNRAKIELRPVQHVALPRTAAARRRADRRPRRSAARR